MGRVAIPNAVWDRPGPLGAADWERARMHAYYTERIVRRAGCLAGVAALAGAAHERVDGAGYPKGTAVPSLEIGARVLGAADVLAALLEDRPHRAAFTEAAAKDEVARMAKQGELDRTAVDAVLAAAGLATAPRTKDDALTDRELEVVRWLARGKSNREIGELLTISPRTVQNHVAHVYDKLGLYSRAGATLWAVERGLLR